MSKQSSKIIIVTSEFPPQPGGIGNHAYNLAKYLQYNNQNVTVIADNRSGNGLAEKEFDQKQTFNTIRVGITRPRFLMYGIRIKKLYAEINSNTVVIATGKFSLWNTALCSVFKRMKKIAVIHGSEVNFSSLILRSLINISLKRFNKVVAVSNFTKSLVLHLNLDIVVIPNGINNNDWERSIKPSISSNSVQLVTVGRISKRKGQHVVINHLKSLQQKIASVMYNCIGINEGTDDLANQVSKMGLTNNVIFHGVLSLDKMKQKLIESQIFVMLSTETSSGDVEGFGIAILEANALGIPAIGSKGSGIEDAINHGFSGLLVDGNNADEFVEAVLEIKNNYKEFSQNAEMWAKKHDWSLLINKYQELL